MLKVLLFIFLIILLFTLVNQNKETFNIFKYDASKFNTQLENRFDIKEIKRESEKDFNEENVKFYKGEYRCLNYQDILLND